MQVSSKDTTSPSSGNKEKNESNPYGHFMEEAHLTSLKIRQEKEAEIQRVQEHWRNQLLNLTEHVRNISHLLQNFWIAAPLIILKFCHVQRGKSHLPTKTKLIFFGISG